MSWSVETLNTRNLNGSFSEDDTAGWFPTYSRGIYVVSVASTTTI